MNEEIFFPPHRGTPFEVLVSCFETEARDFFAYARDYNVDIDELEGEELEEMVSKYSVAFSNAMDSVEHLLEGIYDVMHDVGHAIPTYDDY